jgi:hypothetical protein
MRMSGTGAIGISTRTRGMEAGGGRGGRWRNFGFTGGRLDWDVRGRGLGWMRGCWMCGGGVRQPVCPCLGAYGYPSFDWVMHSRGRDTGMGDRCTGMAMTPSRVEL